MGLRGGANVLRIESGRHYKPKLPVEDRICWCCGEAVEDEMHFMVVCKHYRAERLEMLHEIEIVSDGRLRLRGLLGRQPLILFKLLLGSTLNEVLQI